MRRTFLWPPLKRVKTTPLPIVRSGDTILTHIFEVEYPNMFFPTLCEPSNILRPPTPTFSKIFHSPPYFTFSHNC